MKQPHILILLAVLLLGGMIVSPVSAYFTRMDIQASDSNLNITKHDFEDVTSLDYQNQSTVISVVNIYVPLGATANFTIYYGNGQTVEGSCAYTSVGPGYSKREVLLGSWYDYENFVDYGQISNLLTPSMDRYIISYASNKTEDGDLVSQGFMIHNPAVVGENIFAYFPITNFHTDLITGISITSDNEIDVHIWSDTAENTINLADFTSVSLLDNAQQWINFAIGIAGTLYGFVWMVFGLIKFFFIDNLLLVVALWIAVSMAYSALSSNNIFQFYKKFFHYQRSLLDFFVWMWRALIEIISSFRGIFRI